MPVSGNEKPGFKPIARQSSDSVAGVPIKKRRFPLIRPPSPPSHESSSLPVENDSLQKEHSKPCQESSVSNASVATKSSGLSDTNKNSFSEEKREISADTTAYLVQSDANLSKVKPQEPSHAIYSGSINDMESKEKLMRAEKSPCQIVAGNNELQLAKEALAMNVGKEIYRKPKVEGDCKSEFSTIPGNTELSLGPKEHLVPALAGQNSEGRCQIPEKLDPFSLNLSLSKGKNNIQCKSSDVESNNYGGDLRANRSNWDLNTTMDAWEGSVNDADAGQGTVGFDGLNTTGGTHDIKPFISSTGVIGAGVASGKQIVEESRNRSNFSISSTAPDRLYKSEDSLHLRLSPSFLHSNFSKEHSSSTAKVDTGRVFPNLILPGELVPIGNLSTVGCRTVKSEPVDESTKQDSKGAKGNLMGLLDCRTVKHELVERLSLEALKSANFSTPVNLLDHRSIKSEPVHEGNQETRKGNQETRKTTEGTSSQSDGQVVKCMDNRSCTVAIPITPQMSCPSGFRTCSTELSISGDVSSHSEYSTYTKRVHSNGKAPQEACESVDQAPLEMISLSVGHEGRESNVSDGMISTPRTEDVNVHDPEMCRLKLIDELPPDTSGNGEGSISDEEKINISADMLEEDSYDSDYDSDGNHDLAAAIDTEDKQYGGDDDDYEDGEVREPLVHIAAEGPICEIKEAEQIDRGDSDTKRVDFSGFPGDDHVEEKDTKIVGPGETSTDHIKECVDTVLDEKTDQGFEKDECLQESSAVEMPAIRADQKRLIKVSRKKPLDQSGRKDVPKANETELSSDRGADGNQGTVVTGGQGADENIKETDPVEKNVSILQKTEASLDSDEAAKDTNSGGNRSRIINLPRASNVPSSCKTRPIPGRSLPSQIERERFTDLVLEGDKFHPRGSRDEIYIDGPRKFLRERNQDQSLRNSRVNFMRGRGRVSGRLGTLRGDWDSDRDFAPDLYNGPTDFRFPRHKLASAVTDAELECGSYIIAPDGTVVGTGRGGRKPLNDEVPIFRHPPSRRRSPGGRGGPSTRGAQMGRRIPRNISPNRCIGDDGSDLVGLRHSEKFMRGLPDDIMDPVFTRPQPPYEGVDPHFVRGNRNFLPVQRRGLPRIRSKSPIRSRTRSPGPWSSPRRRSPDGFDGHPELTHRRSPAIYRMERMRSPDRPFYPGEIVARRHGSPPFMPRPSNDMREMDSGRDRGHPRSVIPNRRSPSGRVLPRSIRRFDILDPRERTDSDEYFGGPMQPGRFHELGGDGSGDERRKCGERRGPVRPLRPPYNGADGENFRFHVEDGPRPFRFCPEADSEFQERGNLREREFDRRIKNRPGNAPRRMRSIEEQEGNYRQGGQVWNDDGYDDGSRVKRRRF